MIKKKLNNHEWIKELRDHGQFISEFKLDRVSGVI